MSAESVASTKLPRKEWFFKNLKSALSTMVKLVLLSFLLGVAIEVFEKGSLDLLGYAVASIVFILMSLVVSFLAFFTWPFAIVESWQTYSAGIFSSDVYLCGGGAGSGGLGVYVDMLTTVAFLQPGLVCGAAFTVLMPFWLPRQDFPCAPTRRSFFVVCGLVVVGLTILNSYYLKFAIYVAGGICVGG
jgi:hypothetical protein